MKTFKELTDKFTFVNSNIKSNFPLEEREHGEYKIFHFNRSIPSEYVIKEMEKEGYVPANLFELLSYTEYKPGDFLIALGSNGKVYGSRLVPCLGVVDAGRLLDLYGWDYGWNKFSCFLGVRNSSQALESLTHCPHCKKELRVVIK